MGKKAFVTGGTGFIGSHLVEELLRRDYEEVRCLVRSRLKWLEGLAVVPVRGDMGDDELLREALEDVDQVYHVAGVTRAREWEAFVEGNVTSAMKLLDAVAEVRLGVEKVVLTSSLAAVGPCPDGIAREHMPLRPISRYGKSKAEMEHEVFRWLRKGYDLPIVVIRPPAVYGPREADIYAFFKSIKYGVCPVVGDATSPVLSLVHVRDLVRGMIDAAEAENTTSHTYFLGSDRAYSWDDVKAAATDAIGHKALTVRIPPALVGMIGALVEGMGRLVGRYPPFNREKARELLETCKICSSERAREDFQYEPRIPLDEGVSETIAWYRQHGWL